MTLKNNRAPLLYCVKLCASFQIHRWIQTGVTVRKRLNRFFNSVTLTFDLWPFAWTSLLSLVITPEIFMMIWSEGFDSCNQPSNLTQIGLKSSIFHLVWSWNLMDDNRALRLLYYVKFCPSFHTQIWQFLSHVTLKSDIWPWKTMRHLFYTTLSFVHQFKAICEFKLELQSINAQFGSKSGIFCLVWPWNLMDDLEKQ